MWLIMPLPRYPRLLHTHYQSTTVNMSPLPQPPLPCHRLLLIWWWWSDWHHKSWSWSQGMQTVSIRNINECWQTNWLTLSGAHWDFLHNAVMVIALGWVETPAVRPGEAETSRKNEVTTAHPALVGVTYIQLSNIARHIIFHREVHLLVSATVRPLEQLKCLVVHALWEVISKLDILSTTLNGSLVGLRFNSAFDTE